MAELTPKERLQPSLLDRLTDDAPHKREESRDQRVLSLDRLRAGVIRDLAWLLNTGDLASVLDLESYGEVSRSVLNFGMPDLTGKVGSGIDVEAVETMIKEAIWTFEPRLVRESLRVRARVSREEMGHNALNFEIEGQLWAQPLPLQMYLKTDIDLETGEVSIDESRSRGER